MFFPCGKDSETKMPPEGLLRLSGGILCALCFGAHDRRFTRSRSGSGSQAKPSSANDEKDKKGRYLRRESFSGTCARSFYVGDVKKEDIHAKFGYFVAVVRLFDIGLHHVCTTLTKGITSLTVHHTFQCSVYA